MHAYNHEDNAYTQTHYLARLLYVCASEITHYCYPCARSTVAYFTNLIIFNTLPTFFATAI